MSGDDTIFTICLAVSYAQDVTAACYQEFMKKKIHPAYIEDAKVSCSCGNTFTIGSTKDAIQVEVCSMCHPFYTGQVKYVDTLGKVERFQQKVKKAKKTKALLMEKKKKQDERRKEQQSPKTLREMLLGM